AAAAGGRGPAGGSGRRGWVRPAAAAGAKTPGAKGAAAGGHAAAVPPINMMSSRRLTWSIGLPPTRRRLAAGRDDQPATGCLRPVCRTLNLPRRGRTILGPDLNRFYRGEPLPAPFRASILNDSTASARGRPPQRGISVLFA